MVKKHLSAVSILSDSLIIAYGKLCRQHIQQDLEMHSPCIRLAHKNVQQNKVHMCNLWLYVEMDYFNMNNW